MAKSIALSHSRLSTYNQCPRKFKLQFLDKAFPQEDADKSPHLVRGNNVHKALEGYVVKRLSGQNDIQPSSLKEVETTKPLIDRLFQEFDMIMPEAQVAVDSEYKKVEWFDSNAYYRVIMDIIGKGDSTAFVGDYKTGKINDYSGYGGQLHLTAAITFCVFEDVQDVTAAYLYVDHQKVNKIKFHRSELPALIQHFDAEHVKVNSDKEFKPVPNDFCKWCPATKAQCPYSRKI
jgi:CRISPR/Cas system-associated exonuclease Cas4 (RecB family)